MDDNSASGKPANLAVDLIRQKLRQLYGSEPNASQEAAEADQSGQRLSKHQRFMHELSHSGRSLADIQTEWHNYYQSLPDEEKHQVWQEFYDQHDKSRHSALSATPSEDQLAAEQVERQYTSHNSQNTKRFSTVKKQILSNVRAKAKPKSRHLKSLMFGLICGFVVVFIILFSFFNERFIAPFITPSREVSSTPIIIDPSNTTAGPNPEIIIPKINVEIPVVYSLNTINEAQVENALEDGVVHYATTSNPGEQGNGAIFGHSSNNIFNKGKYKFAFVLLKRLENGDTFTLQKDGKRFVYRVFDKKIVKPEDVSVLGPIAGHPATFSLITCDPPGTSINRLVVSADQISPDPVQNAPSSITGSQPKPAILPSNAPTLWSRFWSWISS